MIATTHSSEIGINKWELDTPALIVDLVLMERNIARMAAYMQGAGVDWRPHTKGIKVPAIAHKAIAAGAIGVTCAKLGEAEVMAGAGIRDILIANQIVGAAKIARLVNLRPHADVIVCVDDADNTAQLGAAAAAKGVTLRVLVEVNLGLNRCGAEPGDAVVALSRHVAGTPGLDFAGVMGWEGHASVIDDRVEKEEACRACVELLVQNAELCMAAGLPVTIVTCAGTATYKYSAHVAGVTEIQAGGGIFTDMAYKKWGADDLDCALTILTTVTSRAAPTRAVLDAGRKTMYSSVALPQAKDIEGVSAPDFSAEHASVELSGDARRLKVGDKIEFIVGYGDDTVFLHDLLYGVRNDRVEVVWPIAGRGKLR